ncbi:MAG: mechanosensitive ion channel family protein [Verrucomicrobiota bacterium]|nr:mechanosensitive ion channel family protein [Verrucomicrobiota bacterium]
MNKTNSIISTNAVSNVADSFKDLGLEWLLDYFTILEPIDYITFIINLMILIFGKQIINHLSVQTVGAAPPQLRLLRILNAVLFLTYFFAVAFQFQLGSNISHTGLLVLLTYLTWQLTHSIILKKYGRKREVEGTSIYVESYTSSNLKLIALLILGVISGLVFLNLWKLEWLLQTTSFLGALAVLIFTTKDYWLKDFISGIIVISNGNIERGDVIRIPDENILAIVLETRTMLTLLRDVIRNHNITVPNSLLLNKQVEILTTESRKGIYDYVEFNIGYETDSEKAKAYLLDVWKRACKITATINAEREGDIMLVENGDHAVTWRVLYNLRFEHEIATARNAVKLAAFELQDEHGVKLPTPLTHAFPGGPAVVSKPPAS